MIDPSNIDDIAVKLPKTATLLEVIDKVNAIIDIITPPEESE